MIWCFPASSRDIGAVTPERLAVGEEPETCLQQTEKLFDRQIGVAEYLIHGAFANTPMVGHDHSRRRPVASKHHVAAALAVENKTRALQRKPHLPPG